MKASWGLNAAGACWIKVTNVKATVNLFSFFYQQVLINENKAIILPSFFKKKKQKTNPKKQNQERNELLFLFNHILFLQFTV